MFLIAYEMSKNWFLISISIFFIKFLMCLNLRATSKSNQTSYPFVLPDLPQLYCKIKKIAQPQFVIQQPTNPAVVVMGAGNCPSCRVGVLVDDYSCCGIFLAIFFFPIGILCCLAMKER